MRGRKPTITWSRVQAVLSETAGCRKEATARLGIGRKTLYRYLTANAPDELKRSRGEHTHLSRATRKRRTRQQPQHRRLIPVMPGGLTQAQIQQALAKNNGSVLHTAVALGVEFNVLYDYFKETDRA